MIQIAEILSFLKRQGIPFTFSGSEDIAVDRFSSLAHYKPGSFTWIKNRENIPEGFDLSQITLAIVPEDLEADVQNAIYTAQSKRAFFAAMEHFYGEEEERPAIGQFTYLSPQVKLGKNVRIGHNCTLDGDITIGDGTVIWNNVTIINRVRIGKDCAIYSGTVIGHDGYGYTEDKNQKKTMVKHFGGVTIGDRVTILEGTAISRGTIDDTIIGDGAKIDALSRIAHNCHIGADVGMALPCALAGSINLGERSYLCGATVLNQLHVGEGAYIGIGSVVLKDVPAEEKICGYPARRFLPKKQDT